MSELIAIRSNPMYTKTAENGFVCTPEIVFIFSEAEYKMTNANETAVKEYVCKTARFTTSISNLRKLAESFTQIADEYEKASDE